MINRITNYFAQLPPNMDPDIVEHYLAEAFHRMIDAQQLRNQQNQQQKEKQLQEMETDWQKVVDSLKNEPSNL